MSVSINDYDLRKAIENDRKFLQFSGLYPPQNQRKRTAAQLFMALINLSLLIAILLSMLTQIVVYRNDLVKILEALLLLLTELTYCCKLINLNYHAAGVLALEDRLTDPLFYGYPTEQLENLKDRIKIGRFIANYFKLMVYLSILFFALVPLLDKSKKMQLPLAGYIPYDVKKPHNYYLTFALQSLAILTSALNNMTMDTLVWMFITLGTAQFDLLKTKLKNIFYDFDNNKFTVREKLKNCIEHHKAIIEYVSQIEQNFSNGIFVQFLASGLVICSTGFQVFFIPFLSTGMIFLMSYLSGMVLQVAMYCWCGHDLMITSAEIGTFFYMSNWYESDVETRKIMLVFMERSKRPVILTAGNFVTLSLVTLTAILKSSYSFFAVLRRLYQDV